MASDLWDSLYKEVCSKRSKTTRIHGQIADNLRIKSDINFFGLALSLDVQNRVLTTH